MITFQQLRHLIESQETLSSFGKVISGIGSKPEGVIPKASTNYREMKHGFVDHEGNYYPVESHNSALQHLIKSVPGHEEHDHWDNDKRMTHVLRHHKAVRVFAAGPVMNINSEHPLSPAQHAVISHAIKNQGYTALQHIHQNDLEWGADAGNKVELARTLRLGSKIK